MYNSPHSGMPARSFYLAPKVDDDDEMDNGNE